MMTSFNKPAFSPRDYLAKLVDQGLVVNNLTQALTYLQYVGAFRLKGYWFHLQDPTTKRFEDALSFDQIIQRYEFDREFRVFAFQAIERLEIAVRTTMANHLALKHGSHWYLQPGIFRPSVKWSYGTLLRKIETEVGRAGKRAYIQAYYDQFTDPYLPQSWAMTECVTFGFWSSTYSILADPNDRKAISKKFKVDVTEVFESWLHAIAYFRNVIAHHDRILKLKPVIGPVNYRQAGIRFMDTKSIYAISTSANYLLSQTGLSCSWKQDLTTLFLKYPDISLSEIGFPRNWDANPGW